MFSNERSEGLAIERPLLHYGKSHDEQQERMRQLANVFIDMFIAQRSEEPVLAEAA
jgi:hypothetical protein